MEMKVSIPGVSFKQSDGSTRHFRNSEYIPYFYIIPKEVVKHFGKQFLDIPREPYKLFRSVEAKHLIESDLYINFISDVTEFMVWHFMGRGAGSYAYSGYEPAWIFTRIVPIWVKGFMDYNSLFSVTTLYLLSENNPDIYMDYTSLDKLDIALNNVVPKVMKQYNMQEILDVAEKYRCHEDFDKCKSRQKIDFIRKWNHSRIKNGIVSLEAWKEAYSEYYDGQEYYIADTTLPMEDKITSELMIEQFISTLSEKDMQILKFRLEGYTQKEIAEMLGYKTHSAVTKRIKAIGEAYEKFTGEDLGFEDEK